MSASSEMLAIFPAGFPIDFLVAYGNQGAATSDKCKLISKCPANDQVILGCWNGQISKDRS